jgi:hypothetical protein
MACVLDLGDESFLFLPLSLFLIFYFLIPLLFFLLFSPIICTFLLFFSFPSFIPHSLPTPSKLPFFLSLPSSSAIIKRSLSNNFRSPVGLCPHQPNRLGALCGPTCRSWGGNRAILHGVLLLSGSLFSWPLVEPREALAGWRTTAHRLPNPCLLKLQYPRQISRGSRIRFRSFPPFQSLLLRGVESQGGE